MKLIKRTFKKIFKSKIVKTIILPTGVVCTHYANGHITTNIQ